MDVTINLNLTPTEARQPMGLPEVQRLQDAALAKMQDGIMAQADLFSAEGLMDLGLEAGRMRRWTRFAA